MPNIVIRHLSGTKANQVEEISLQGFHEVLIGREANAHVRFDADREDLVSRNHARIVRDPADPTGFLLTDLDSRNGTFINRQRIYGASRLQHGDRVQLGPSGPEFSFELDPAPAARPTRMAYAAAAPATREALVGSSVSGTAMPPGMADMRQGSDGPRPVGRATVERLVGEVAHQMKGENRKTAWTVVLGILVVLVAGYAYFDSIWKVQAKNAEATRKEQVRILALNEAELNKAQADQKQATQDLADSIKRGNSKEIGIYKARAANAEERLAVAEKAKEKAKKDAEVILANNKVPVPTLAPNGDAPPALKEISPEEIHAANLKSVILFDATWTITDTGTGAQIYLYHHRNDLGACTQAAKTEFLPMFIDDGGTLSPVLSTLPNEGNNTPIVGTHSGSGFIVGSEGYFLTNRHVMAPWRATWNLADFTRKSVGLKMKNNSIVGCIPASEFPNASVPSEGSKMVVDKIESVMNTASGVSTKSTYSDRLKYNPLQTSVQGEAIFNVTFSKTTQRYRATSVTVSEKHDVALGKVDTPSGAQKVTMFTDSDAIRPGQPVVVMGYPAISPDAFGVEVSRDMFTNRAHLSAIADPTLTTGPVSKVIASGNSIKGVDGYISSGEVYQLGINTTGAGNSGGPVFDSKGRVIAIFYAGGTRVGASVTFAVPVKFGKELIDNPSVMR